jgi:hypothetical protein
MTGRLARRWALFSGLALAAACDATHLQAVGSPGGGYRSGAGCPVDELQAGGALACQAPAQLGFEQVGDDALLEIQEGNIGGKQLSCRRTWCGGGALSVHADFRWKAGTSSSMGEKLGQLRYRLATPLDIYDKTLTYALYLDGPDTPVNAFIAAVDTNGLFHMIDDGPVPIFRRWTQRGAAIRPGNVRLNLPEGTTSLVVNELVIAVYLATDVRSGDHEHWSADLYLDQLGWN